MTGASTLRLAWRSAWRNPRRTAVVVVSVAVGLAGCLLVMAFNYGMVVQMVETAISTELGHIQVHASGFDEDPRLSLLLEGGGEAAARAIADRPETDAWARRVRSQGLVNSPRASVGVRVLAVEPGREPGVSSLPEEIVEGEWLQPGSRRVAIGAALARRLSVGVGDKLVLSVQDLNGDLTGQAYRVGALFETASRELNEGVLLMPLAEAQRLLALGDGISEVVLRATSRKQVADLRTGLAEALGPEAEVQSWEELAPLLVYMVDVFDQIAWVTYGAVFVAMAFGIANVLLMSVYERTREIGVMMAVGMKPRRVVAAVVAESLLVTGIGLALGVALGLLSVFALSDGIDLSLFAGALRDFGVGTRLVPALRTADLVDPLVLAFVSALLASTWPALRAAGLRPSEALRRT